MKKSALLMTMSLWVLVLAWCNCNCKISVNDNCDIPNESKEFCLDNWWTYYDVTSIDET